MTKCTPTCDAEKAVLVEALTSLRARATRSGDASTLEHRIRMADTDIRLIDVALANTSSSALLARGERLERWVNLFLKRVIEVTK
ncbi:hypothetical protein LCGC14_2842990, partial [marine sediment metagenome]